MFGVMNLAIFARGDTTTAAVLAVATVLFAGVAALLIVVSVGAVMWMSRPITYEPDAPPSFYVPSDR